MSNQVLDQTRAWQMQMQQQQYRPNAAQDMNHHNQAQVSSFSPFESPPGPFIVSIITQPILRIRGSLVIADLMKRQQAVRQQHLAQQLQHQQQQQQQQQHPQQQQPFLNAGMAQMGGGPVMGGNGQQPFHDAASGHPQQNHMQGGFQNTGAESLPASRTPARVDQHGPESATAKRPS
ncbi:hypothetical protein NLJ89_g12388 [Agrocybe chaxingu]|uniref:Uncharacterized protein n=1 Tax=Agrocybe chaxingu TaxID=84603 RepID=A0A9W8MNJ1_9AGAR|nr:hypothetical protein NLJ89_g12388 [Agrocybe chaxingu]